MVRSPHCRKRKTDTHQLSTLLALRYPSRTILLSWLQPVNSGRNINLGKCSLRDVYPSTLKVFVRANVPITATPLPEGKRPFLGGSPGQIAQDLTRVQNLKVDEVFFSDQASPTVDEAVQRLEEIQTAVRR